MARSAPTLTAEQLQTKSKDYFTALFNKPDPKNINVTTSYSTTDGSTLTITASGSVDTTFTRIMGFTSLERRLVVDDQMGQPAPARRARARHHRLDGERRQDRRAEDRDQKPARPAQGRRRQQRRRLCVDRSVQPRRQRRPANYDASWIDWTDWEDEPPVIKTNKPSNWDQIGPGSSCPFSNSNHGFRCTIEPANGSDNVSNIPSSGTYSGYICPSIDNGWQDHAQSSVYYNGCYNSQPTITTSQNTICTGCDLQLRQHAELLVHRHRQQQGLQADHDEHRRALHPRLDQERAQHLERLRHRSRQLDDAARAQLRPEGHAPVAGNAGLAILPAQQYGYCSPAVRALSYDWTAMKTLVDDLYPAGSTNQPIGLVWGWQSLVGGGPFGTMPAKDANYIYKEVIILLSDGLNTQDRWYGNGSASRRTSTTACGSTGGAGTCKNIKDAGDHDLRHPGQHRQRSRVDADEELRQHRQVRDAHDRQPDHHDVPQIGTQLSQLRIAK